MSHDGLDDRLRTLAQAALGEAEGRVVLAVSGGGDSMACLDLFGQAAREADCPLAAVTVDHGLRPEARAEVAFVAETARAGGIEHAVLAWSWDGRGNLQAAARAARYRLIGDWARATGIGHVILAHTLDDVAETLLLRLPRSPGVDGLAEMPRRFRRDGVGWLRPFLDVSRADLRRHLAARGLAWAEDPSNEDPRFDRARARRVLDALAPLGVERPALAAVSRHLAEARAALAHYSSAEAARRVVEDRGDLLLTLPTDDLPAEIGRQLLRAALRWVSGGAAPRQAALETMVAGLAGDGATTTLAGCRISRDGPRLRIAREYASVRERRSGPGELWDGRWRLDGPSRDDLHVSALGPAVSRCPRWRETGLPRSSLMATPALWAGEDLFAAPLAGAPSGWTARPTGRSTFAAFCLRD